MTSSNELIETVMVKEIAGEVERPHGTVHFESFGQNNKSVVVYPTVAKYETAAIRRLSACKEVNEGLRSRTGYSNACTAN